MTHSRTDVSLSHLVVELYKGGFKLRGNGSYVIYFLLDYAKVS